MRMKKNRAVAVVVVMALFLGLLTFTAAVGFDPQGRALQETLPQVLTWRAE